MDKSVLILVLILPLSLLLIRKYRYNKLFEKEEIKFYMIQVNKFLDEIKKAKKDYFDYKKKEDLLSNYEKTYESSEVDPYNKIKNKQTREFKNIYKNLEELVKKWNDEYIDKELEECKDMFDDIDRKSLDKQQRKAVVYDEINNLIVAGAGSGKTLTVSAKVKYLVERKDIDPEKILLISFTRKAANEMSERITSKLNINANAMTFHKLGLEIIKNKKNERPDIETNMNRILNNYFKKNITNSSQRTKDLMFFLGTYFNLPEDWEKYDNLGQMYEHIKSSDFQTLKGKKLVVQENKKKIEELKRNKETIKGETVKSIEEVIIANYLFLNGIDYKYEFPYPYEQENKYRKKYRPDFYLPEYDVYIEHFGISEEFKTPWLNFAQEEEYLEGIKWKRKEHKKNKTTLIETYSYYNKEGILLEKLEEKLRINGIKPVEVDYKKIFNAIYQSSYDNYYMEFIKLIKSFLSLFKSNCFEHIKFAELMVDARKTENPFVRNRTIYFLKIVESAYVYYQESLEKENKIDFNDMINKAIDIIKSETYGVDYDYIIVDEFQDISLSRYKLIKAIQESTKSKVVCVGDDWQSIYRFAGSNIGIFTNFTKYFGYSKLLKIEKTYRNSQRLINIAGRFIMENKSQIEKNLISDKKQIEPIKIFPYKSDRMSVLIEIIDEIVMKFGSETEILLLGRNNSDLKIIPEITVEEDEYKSKMIEKDKTISKESEEDDENNPEESEDKYESKPEIYLIKGKKNEFIIKNTKYPNLNISFLTVHRSKGVEAENVILLNATNNRAGFPNKIADDPLLSLVLTDLDDFAYAEERRLFYVALTRTKNITYILSPEEKNDKSIFVNELVEKHIEYIENQNDETTIQNKPNCPKCQEGTLVLRKNSRDNSLFLGCSNYPLCDFTNKNIEIIDNQIKCNQCGGYMIKRKGKYGKFYGCTNYPYCKNTLEIYDKEERIASNR